MRYRLLLAFILTLALLPHSCKENGFLENRGDLTILHLKGSPYDRGQLHGQLLRQEILETISGWKREVENEFQCSIDTVIARLFSVTTYEAELRNNHPDLLEEVRGISESSGIDYRTLLAFQLSEEMFTVLDQDPSLKCTAIGIAGTDSFPTLLAQNMDPPQFLHGHPFVMHIIPGRGEPESFVFTVPGLLGMSGVNEKGVAVTCMSISMLNHSSGGEPVVSVVRTILRQDGLNQAVEYLEQASYAIPQCYTIGGPEEIRCFECSANDLAEFYPFEEQNIALHTNFSIRNRDFNSNYIELLARYGKSTDDPYFCPRFFHAYDKIEECSRKLDVERIEAILRLPEPEMESILNENTLGTLVMELDSDPVLHLALGNEAGAAFHSLTFR
jgi:hypothetical protein